MSVSILLADDQPLLRRGFRMILEAEDDLTVVAEAGNGEEAVELVRRHTPDVALMDIRMPGTDGIEATQRITAAGPLPKVLVLTTFDLDEYAFGALRAGASGSTWAYSSSRRRVTRGETTASPVATVLMAATRSPGRTSLSRKPLAPARSAPKAYSSRSNVVSTSTLGSGPAAVIR